MKRVLSVVLVVLLLASIGMIGASADVGDDLGEVPEDLIPTDPPGVWNEESHFWDAWPPFLQWMLRYLLFGWLWMQWA